MKLYLQLLKAKYNLKFKKIRAIIKFLLFYIIPNKYFCTLIYHFPFIFLCNKKII